MCVTDRHDMTLAVKVMLNPLEFNDPQKRKLQKHSEKKGENAGNQHCLLFPQCFLPNPFERKIII